VQNLLCNVIIKYIYSLLYIVTRLFQKRRQEMKKKNSLKVLLVVAGAISLSWSVSAGAIGEKPDSSPSLYGRNGDSLVDTTESGGRRVWNGGLTGQASSPVKTDFVKGFAPSTGAGAREVWNGCLIGQASSPLKTDLAVLSASRSEARDVRKGYLTGSFCSWQQEL
jgi:hypothetical protein